MHILVLSKRQYTGKDLLDDCYGRVFELPADLALRGHEVRGLALSYRPRREGEYAWRRWSGLTWHSFNCSPSGLIRYWRHLRNLIDGFQPQLIWASSDVFHLIFAWLISRKYKIPLFVDLYDNYESFSASKIPGVISLFRLACRSAAGVTAVSHTLKERVRVEYGLNSVPEVIGNGVSRAVFFPREQKSARHHLGLPENAKLIGTAGAITGHRGIEDLFQAFLILAKEYPNLWLVFAGPRDGVPARYRHERIVDLGILPSQEVSFLFSALDVAVISNRDSAFGRYCFPQKLHEIAACKTPIIAAAVGEVARLLADFPSNLYPPGKPEVLAKCIAQQLESVSGFCFPILEWKDCGSQLETHFLEKLAR